jgi:hypothetical protein
MANYLALRAGDSATQTAKGARGFGLSRNPARVPVPFPRTRPPGIARAVLVSKAMARNPDERFQSADEMRVETARVLSRRPHLDDGPCGAAQHRSRQRQQPSRRRSGLAAGVLAGEPAQKFMITGARDFALRSRRVAERGQDPRCGRDLLGGRNRSRAEAHCRLLRRNHDDTRRSGAELDAVAHGRAGRYVEHAHLAVARGRVLTSKEIVELDGLALRRWAKIGGVDA